jgi:succinate-semialdehyde dehydrogenase/glutarate-semialdehyde dehydrogenase
LQRSGYFFEPTILADVPVTANIMQTEPFGPIAAVSAFTDLDAAIAAANKVDYGLAAYAFSDSAATLDQLTSGLEVGHLSINHFGGGVPEGPFGGVKYSGLGREGGVEGLQQYFVEKYVSHRLRLEERRAVS